MLARFSSHARGVFIGVVGCAMSCAALAQPANNACSNAVQLPAAGGVFTGDMSGATRDALSTSCPASQTGTDVYFSITPTSNAIYTIETCGSSFDTVLSVHAATCPVSMATEVAGGCNDDACGFQSRVRVLLLSGQSYLIRLGTFNASTAGGAYTLQVTQTPQAANDECGTGNPQLTLDTPLNASNIGATTSFVINPASTCGGFSGSGGASDMFYRFTPPSTGAYTFSTCSPTSTLDTVISVHGSCADPLTSIIGCNDDAGPSGCASNQFSSSLTVALTGGQTYAVRVAGYRGTSGGSVGPFTLLVTRSTMATGACCKSSGVCTIALSGTCSDQYLGDSVLCSPNPCAGPPQGACCTTSGACELSASDHCTGTYMGDWTACSPSICPAYPGACCIGATCRTSLPSECVPIGLAGAVFKGPGTSCQSAAGPICCYADFNKANSVTIQDIFDFLNEWFSGSATAQVGGSGQGSPVIQDIFSFLNAWFAGGC